MALELLPHLYDITANRRRRLQAAVEAAIDQIANAIPEAVIVPPAGGSILWAEFRSTTLPTS